MTVLDNTAGQRVLVVEDDPSLAAMLEELLTSEGYSVEVAPDGQRGLHRALTGDFDVLVLDRGLPAIEGLDVLSRLRRSGIDVPTLVLSARALARDRVEGLDAGAEDYLGKPFDIDELLARVRALLRRRQGETLQNASGLPLAEGRLDTEERCVVRPDGSAVALSRRETDLLAVLARRPRRTFTREELLELAFPGAEDAGAIDTYVHYLRRKLGRGAVETVHGMGYRLGRR